MDPEERPGDARAPNLFIPGFTKAGTTTLAAALAEHSQVFVPFVKEPQFFSNDVCWEEGLERQLRQHYRGAERFPVRVDATPHYLFYEKAAVRIGQVVPVRDQRFIVMLRDPVARAYSMYWNMRLEGHEPLSFEDALAAESERSETQGRAVARLGTLRFQYFESGLYAQQLERWQARLPDARFLFVLTEDLQSDLAGVVRRACEFAALPPVDTPARSPRNPAAEARSPRLQRWLRTPSRARALVGRALPAPWRARIAVALLRLNRRSITYPPMRRETEEVLRERYAADVGRLERLIARDLSRWRTREAQAGSTSR
jgi:hypothetical protein